MREREIQSHSSQNKQNEQYQDKKVHKHDSFPQLLRKHISISTGKSENTIKQLYKMALRERNSLYCLAWSSGCQDFCLSGSCKRTVRVNRKPVIRSSTLKPTSRTFHFFDTLC